MTTKSHAHRAGAGSTRRSLTAALVALSCSVGVLTACGDDDDSTATTTAPAGGGSSSVLPPIIADLNSIDGTTVEVPAGGTIDLTGDSTTYTDWTGEISDPKVAEFVAGKDEGGASFNPGIKALEAGEAEVTLNNSTSNKTVTFTVKVT
jgi:hypothetical protein